MPSVLHRKQARIVDTEGRVEKFVKKFEGKEARVSKRKRKQASAERRKRPYWREKRVWPKRRRRKKKRSEKKPGGSGLRSAPPGKRPRRRKKNPSRPKRLPWPRMLPPDPEPNDAEAVAAVDDASPDASPAPEPSGEAEKPRTHKPGASRVCPGDCPWAAAPRQTRIHGPGLHAGPPYSLPVG